jgi:hypothetical protein
MGKFVVAATCPDEIEARLAQATLAAAGIESFLKSEDIGGMIPALLQSKGVQILVAEENLEEARTVLTTSSEEQADE